MILLTKELLMLAVLHRIYPQGLFAPIHEDSIGLQKLICHDS